MKRITANRKVLSAARQLASITAAGASAILLTGGKAEADIIISNVLDVTIGFSSNSNPAPGRATVASHLFHSLAGGPSFAFRAVSFGNQRSSTRGNRHYSSLSLNRFIEEDGAGFAVSGPGLVRFAAGAEYTARMGIGNGFNIGQRQWNTIKKFSSSTVDHPYTSRSTSHRNTTTNGLPSFTDKYFLFVFAGATTEYGWVEASMSVTGTGGPSASHGPNLTIVQYAFDNTGAYIAAGDVGTPEPSTLAESSLAALILGAEGLRRWRNARKNIA